MAAYDFYFTRLMYESGDWDVDVRMPSNVLNSLVEYTTLQGGPGRAHDRAVGPEDAGSAVLLPGRAQAGAVHAGRARNFERYVKGGGFVFVDDCNHDIDGLFAKSFEAEMAKIFGAKALQKIPNNHPVYSSFFTFDGPPNTSVELNGWGDDLVHEYLKAIEVGGRARRAVLEQGLRLRVGLRLPQQALAGGRQHPLCGQHHSIRVGSMKCRREQWTGTKRKSPTWWRQRGCAEKDSMGKVIIGQKDVVDLLVICLLAGGHALVEGVPGLGKTLLVKSLAQATDMQFRRVQFTPDLMPSDIVGTEILEEDTARASACSASSGAPCSRRCCWPTRSTARRRRPSRRCWKRCRSVPSPSPARRTSCPSPFFVLATQNPIEQAGTYPLPEAQLDRFLLRIDVGYPTEDEEDAMVSRPPMRA
jgi:hypothetical protein